MKTTVRINKINILLGLFLWFLMLTDLEWNSVIANMVFPLVVFLTALFSYRAATKDADKKKKRRSFWFYVPSFSGAVLYYLFIIVFVFYGFLGCLFWFTEQTHKIKLHRCYSPDRTLYCDMYFYPVGAYSGGTGRVEVYLIPTVFPVLRKDIWYEHKSYIDPEDTSCVYIRWKDNDTVQMYPLGQSEIIKVKGITFYPYELVHSL